MYAADTTISSFCLLYLTKKLMLKYTLKRIILEEHAPEELYNYNNIKYIQIFYDKILQTHQMQNCTS